MAPTATPIGSPVSVGLALCASAIVAVTIAGCGRAGADDYEDAAQRAVRSHIASAKAGDVSALRGGACGPLATAMSRHSDDGVRSEFVGAYAAGPDRLAADSRSSDDPARRQTVTGFYEHAADLEILFVVEDHDGWKICEIRKGNGIFGPLPGPFGPAS